MNNLLFNNKNYVVKTAEFQGECVKYRAFENIVYVEYPLDPIQKLSIYVPEQFYEGKSINGYNLTSAPILVPNTVGGYMPGPVSEPGKPIFNKEDVIFRGLQHGYVVVVIGIRGRKLEHQVGVAPACIVDYKAGIRYLRFNKHNIPGDTEKIISDGTSAGGALSALLATTGNHPDYEPYLTKLGAAKEKDDIFAASCYCPITNLENADMAYEWEFNGMHDYVMHKYLPNHKVEKIPGRLDENQIKLSKELKQLFIKYIHHLQLSYQGNKLTEHDVKQYIKGKIIDSANKAIQEGVDVGFSWLKIEDNKVVDIDYVEFIKYRGRMKPTPAFDSIEMNTPENELFGTSDVNYQHFTEFSKMHSLVEGTLADKKLINMLNPMHYMHDAFAKKAKAFRIRHGAIDRDTSLVISALLALSLSAIGCFVDHFYPWEIDHAGDYDTKDLFAWIDSLCK